MKTAVPPLFSDQRRDIKQELDVGRVVDFSEPGTGKTRKRIEVFAKRRTRGGKCALVLAPKSLLRSAWEFDVRKYASWVKTSVAYAENREKAFDAVADIYITNHDGAKWLAKQPASFFRKFDYLVVDESDAFKHHTSQRSKALDKIKGHFKYRAIMNGYPTCNGILDIWNQVKIVDDGQRLGKSFYAFRAAACIPKQCGPSPNMVRWEDRDGIEEEVADLVKDIAQRSMLKNVPDNHVTVLPFYMSKSHMAAYKEMEKEAVLELKSGDITAVNAAVLSTKLLQIASGAAYDDNGDYQVIDTTRYEMVADLAEARRHSVVFFLWKHQRDLLLKEFKKRGMSVMVIDGDVSNKKRFEYVQMYQSGMYRVALMHPKSGAHGLTLTRGTATIWPGPTHDLSWWLQGNRRVNRTGQTQETETINIVAEGTYEEKVYSSMGVKNVKLTDLLRSIV